MILLFISWRTKAVKALEMLEICCSVISRAPLLRSRRTTLLDYAVIGDTCLQTRTLDQPGTRSWTSISSIMTNRPKIWFHQHHISSRIPIIYPLYPSSYFFHPNFFFSSTSQTSLSNSICCHLYDPPNYNPTSTWHTSSSPAKPAPQGQETCRWPGEGPTVYTAPLCRPEYLY